MVNPMRRSEKKAEEIKKNEMMGNKQKKNVVYKFLILFSVIIIYGFYVLNEFGIEQGLLITGLTWSVFVFCVPFAASDVLVGLPLRVLFNMKLLLGQMIVWVGGAAINIYAFFTNPDLYQSTPLLQIFHHILSNPIPYWTILGLCGFGTFISVLLADDVLDDLGPKKKRHPKKLELLFLVILIAIGLVYSVLLSELQVSLHH